MFRSGDLGLDQVVDYCPSRIALASGHGPSPLKVLRVIRAHEGLPQGSLLPDNLEPPDSLWRFSLPRRRRGCLSAVSPLPSASAVVQSAGLTDTYHFQRSKSST